MTKRKVGSLVLALALCLGILGGCGTKKEEAKESTATVKSEEAKTSEQDTAAKELELAVEKATAKAKEEMREQLDNLRDEKTRLQVQMSMMQK